MNKKSRRLNAAKKSPKFIIGDKVTAPGFEDSIHTDDKVLEIESSFWNGFTYMYHFKGSDMGLGEPYLVRHTILATPQ